jgi:monothiol glutaredoxin
MAISESARQTIEGLLEEHRVLLFMKGTPSMPQCGFSAKAVGILGSVAPGFGSFNVLEDQDVREGIKEFGNWPTIPQLYIDRELVGGSDIISQMFNAGELHQMLGLEAPDRTPPEISISDSAAQAILSGMEGQAGGDLHFQIDEYWRAQFMLQPAAGGEIKVEANGVVLYLDVISAQRARGVEIDFTESFQGTGLTVNIPLAPPPVGHMSVQDLKSRLDEGADFMLVDTRSEADRAKVPFPHARGLDAQLMEELADLPRETELVFICNQGQSSVGTAEHYRKEGFTRLVSVDGGVNQWVQDFGPAGS